MSGHKKATITINQQEYDRLRESESEMRSLAKDLESLKAQLAERTTNQFQEHYKDLEIRQSVFEHVLAGVDTHIKNIELENNQRFLDQASACMMDVRECEPDVNKETREEFFNLMKDLETKFSEQHQQYQDDLASLQTQFSSVKSNQKAKISVANMWLDAGLTLSSYINDNYQHNNFCPGEWDRADRDLMYALENQKLGMPEAVVVAAQQVYSRLSDLRINLEMKMLEWQSAYMTTVNGLESLKLIAIQNEKCNAIDSDGQILPEQIDVNYWSSGEYGQFMLHLQDFISSIYNQNTEMAIDDLYQIIDSTIPKLTEELESIIFFSRMNVIKSQLRINLADLIVQALEQQGFGLVGGEYAQNDMRNPFNARVRNRAGSEIVVQVVPYPDDLRNNDFHLITIDRENITQHEMINRAEEISQSLRNFGLEVSPVQTKSQSNTTIAKSGGTTGKKRLENHYR